MSRDLYFACKDCKEKMWVGQKKRFYDQEQIIDFLDKHDNHSLVYTTDYTNVSDIGEYKEVDIVFKNSKYNKTLSFK